MVQVKEMWKQLHAGLLPLTFEGNIASGKSSLVRSISGHYNLEMIMEDVESNPFLHLFYQALANPKNEEYRRAFMDMQVWLLGTRTTQKRAYSHFCGQYYVSDRDMLGDLAFWGLLKEAGNISQKEYDWLKNAITWTHGRLSGDQLYKSVIWLETSPESCFERKNKRARSEEDMVPQQYFRDLDRAYKQYVWPEWISRKVDFYVVNWDCDRESELVEVAKNHFMFKEVPVEIKEIITKGPTSQMVKRSSEGIYYVA